MFFKGLLNKKDKIFKNFIGNPFEWYENSSLVVIQTAVTEPR